ncbi:MAG: SH3 domain-containing protein [Clostridiales bacterium]|nr:SH3 domain-containing protein [Clostridiales bacterium]
MIRNEDAIAAARALIGTPYSELDCINLIKRVIRTAPGGVPWYTTAGTNALWVSANASAKYRDLTWRQEGIQGARAGELAFKRHGGDVHHVGIVTERGTVIHSSSVYGKVVETPLDESWQLLAVHRYIEAASAAETEASMGAVLYRVVVNTARDPLNVRDSPSTSGRKIGELTRGTTVDVLAEPCEGWLYVRGDGVTGYASAAYLVRVTYVSAGKSVEDVRPTEMSGANASSGEAEEEPYTTIRREDGTTIRLAGRWAVLED